MHCLEVIVAKNERAAGREAGHAHNDRNEEHAIAIVDAAPMTDSFVEGFLDGKREG
jgi:hypothetical protein